MPIGLVIRRLKDVHITATNRDDLEFRQKYDPDRVNILNIPDGVTEIEKEAFEECTGLTEVHLPESLTSIEEVL